MNFRGLALLTRSAKPWCLLLALILATPLASAAEPQPAGGTSGAGLPPLTVESAAALNRALAEFDRSPNTVVAQVGDRSVTWGDVADVIRQMPRITAGIPFQQLYQTAVVRVMRTRALALRAEAVGLDKLPVVRRRVKNAGDEALANEVLVRSLAPNVAEKGLRAVYDGLIAGKPGPIEVHPRIIVLDTEDTAVEIIERLQRGADIVALAREFSTDGTAANGGDLGFVRRDMLTPELGAVVFALGVGQTTAYPVSSGNKWFVIRIEGRRQAAPLAFDDARLPLEHDVFQAGAEELRKQALQAAKVTYYGLTGKAVDQPK